jgi:hypothetical protein
MRFAFDETQFFDSYKQQFGSPLRQAEQGLKTLLAAVARDPENWASIDQLAYGFATFKWETAHTFQPIFERGSLEHFNRYELPAQKAKDLGNTQVGDGFLFRGRGYVQLTGRSNYSRAARELGIDLITTPDLALQAEPAYEIASRGMRDGWFTARKLATFIPVGGTPDFVNARRIINGTDQADTIAAIAKKFQIILNAAQTTPAEDASAASV